MRTANRIQTSEFGRTDLRVTLIGLGGGQIGQQGTPPRDVERLLNTMLDDGLGVIDTSSSYGLSEEMIGDFVGHRRDEYLIFTKAGDAGDIALPHFTRDKMEQEIERSLRRLKTDRIDVLQIHTCPKEDLERGEVVEVMQRAKEQGKCRFIGYSGDSDAAEYAVRMGVFDTLQISVNIADQEAIDRGILQLAKEQDMGVIAKRSIANTAWRMDQNELQDIDSYQERLKKLDYDFIRDLSVENAAQYALRFTLAVPDVDVALVGLRSIEHWKADLAAVQAGPLPSDEYEVIRQRWQELAEPDWRGQN